MPVGKPLSPTRTTWCFVPEKSRMRKAHFFPWEGVRAEPGRGARSFFNSTIRMRQWGVQARKKEGPVRALFSFRSV
jgi:hypothetical protein